MIKKLNVTDLFGQFTYEIDFKPTGISILTGPNGYGKSTILKIIYSVVEEGLYELGQYPFKSLTIESNDGKRIFVDKISASEISVNDIKLLLISPREAERYSKRFPFKYFEEIGPNQFFDRRTGDILNEREMATLRERYVVNDEQIKDRLIWVNHMRAKREQKAEGSFIELDNYYSEFKKSLGEIKFIKEQRLIREEKSESRYYGEEQSQVIEVIKEIPKKLETQIKEIIINYSQISSKLDSSFPKRLFDTNIELSQREYLDKLGEIILKQEKISDYNLLKDMRGSTTSTQHKYRRDLSTALSIYLDDTRTKLEVFDDLIKKLDLYKEIIDKKLFNKHVEVSSAFGLRILREDGVELPLEKLSSGEKQIIVLYYDLIFGVENKLVLLIDEPEISLHVAWQREMLNDFNKIVELRQDSFSIVIATHSPQLINNHWDMVVDLGDINGK
ncbi:MAG: hypothetical protein E7346_07225 [Clostridiales bacterium]|nr:hypothetical protein [Clostridiales bacterium]